MKQYDGAYNATYNASILRSLAPKFKQTDIPPLPDGRSFGDFLTEIADQLELATYIVAQLVAERSGIPSEPMTYH